MTPPGGRLGWIAALALSACTAPERGTCEGDADCPPGFRCEGAACLCTADEACGDGAFCNSAGRCQARPGCRSNAGCGAAEICDLVSGACVPASTCRTAVHCEPGQVCQGETCVSGCRDHADCPLYRSCHRPDGGDAAALGTCQATCLGHDYCPLGAVCVGGDCYPGSRAHCADCSTDGECLGSTDYCLVNASFEPGLPSTGTEYFCAVDCEADPSVCPNGYGCQDVVVLTSSPCRRDADCNGGGRVCGIREGANRGLCTCVRDLDCAYVNIPPRCSAFGFCVHPPGRLCGRDEDCEPIPLCGEHGASGRRVCYNEPSRSCVGPSQCLCGDDGRCINSGRPCDSGGDCNPPCVDGRCRLGSACAPAPGLFCPDLR